MRTIGGPAAWRGADIRDSAEWQVVLDGPQRAELLSALDVLKTAAASRPDNPLRVVTVEDFPLSRLEPVFAAALGDVVDSRGFTLVRGVPIEGLPDEDIELLYWGIGLQFGNLGNSPLCYEVAASSAAVPTW